MDWIIYNGQTFENGIPYLFCFKDLKGVTRYDIGRCRDGKPFIVGNFFAFDVVGKLLAFAKVIEFTQT